VPTFVFHPRLTLRQRDLLDTIDALDLVDHVSPIQLAIRLLVPQRSRLLELAELRAHLGAFDADTLTYRWRHPDPRVDDLQRDVMALVGLRLAADRRILFDEVRAMAFDRAQGRPFDRAQGRRTHDPRARAPPCRISTSPGTVERSRMQSSWLCCSANVERRTENVERSCRGCFC
jgi:hypothetical protein